MRCHSAPPLTSAACRPSQPLQPPKIGSLWTAPSGSQRCSYCSPCRPRVLSSTGLGKATVQAAGTDPKHGDTTDGVLIDGAELGTATFGSRFEAQGSGGEATVHRPGWPHSHQRSPQRARSRP
jgi:hypothetical protein